MNSESVQKSIVTRAPRNREMANERYDIDSVCRISVSVTKLHNYYSSGIQIFGGTVKQNFLYVVASLASLASLASPPDHILLMEPSLIGMNQS